MLSCSCPHRKTTLLILTRLIFFHSINVVYLDRRSLLSPLSPVRRWHSGNKSSDDSFTQKVEADSETRRDEQ